MSSIAARDGATAAAASALASAASADVPPRSRVAVAASRLVRAGRACSAALVIARAADGSPRLSCHAARRASSERHRSSAPEGIVLVAVAMVAVATVATVEFGSPMAVAAASREAPASYERPASTCRAAWVRSDRTRSRGQPCVERPSRAAALTYRCASPSEPRAAHSSDAKSRPSAAVTSAPPSLPTTPRLPPPPSPLPRPPFSPRMASRAALVAWARASDGRPCARCTWASASDTDAASAQRDAARRSSSCRASRAIAAVAAAAAAASAASVASAARSRAARSAARGSEPTEVGLPSSRSSNVPSRRGASSTSAAAARRRASRPLSPKPMAVSSRARCRCTG